MSYKHLYLLLILFLVSVQLTHSQPTHVKVIYHTGTLEEAYIESEKINKPILIYAYTSHCGYCRKMEQETLCKGGIIDIFNRDFIPMKMDMEKGNGPQLAKKFGFRGYPTILILDANGTIITKIVGFKSYEELKELLLDVNTPLEE